VVSVSGDQKTLEAGAFAKEIRATFPVVHDPKAKIFEKFGVEPLPSNLVIDRNGKVVESVEGADLPRLEAAIRKVIGK
jgi:peroxiredoxin